jgi:hypothetical protein
MVLSSLRCGCNAVVGCGPEKPPSRGNIPGNSGEDMSGMRNIKRALERIGGFDLTIFPIPRVHMIFQIRRSY